MTGLVHVAVVLAGASGQHGSHERRMVVAIGAGEFDHQLVFRVDMAAAAEVATQQGAGPGADDELVARIVAAALEHGALHGGQDVALEGAGHGQPVGFIKGGIAEFGGAPHIVHLGRALNDAQTADQLRSIIESAETIQGRFDHAPASSGQAISLELDTELATLTTVLIEDRLEVFGRGRTVTIDPDPDVLKG